jgi:hypothetical protein
VRFALIAALSSLLAVLAVSGSARAYQEEGEERVDYTAYTLNPWEAAVGPFKAELGLPGGFMIGTYLPPWVIGPAVGALVPTGYVKVRDPFHGPVAVSVRSGFMYFNGASLASKATDTEGAKAGLWVLPFELAISSRFSDLYSQSLLVTFVHAFGDGSETGATSIQGAAATNNFSVSTLLEMRMSRVVALTLLGRLLLHQGTARVSGSYTQGSTTVDADLGARPRSYPFMACVVPGIAFSWAHINLNAGVGYGTWWLPIVELPLTSAQIVPELSFYIRF